MLSQLQFDLIMIIKKILIGFNISQWGPATQVCFILLLNLLCNEKERLEGAVDGLSVAPLST